MQFRISNIPNSKPMENNHYPYYDRCFNLCDIVGRAYATGEFDLMYPYLSEDCKWTSYWTYTDRIGKKELITYFNEKGKAIVESEALGDACIVELENGQPSILLGQNVGDSYNLMLIILELNADGMIKEIDLMEPSLYRFRKIMDISVNPVSL